jgi:MFS family permease
MALTAAILGWMFDGLEMGLFPLVGRPALRELGRGTITDANIGTWFSVIIAVFLLGAAAGGLFFGYLGDRIGRVRAMVLSVLTYTVFSGLCAFVQTPAQLAVLRFIASLGMGGEWALGVALVMELWPSASRPLIAGMIGAAANVGYLLIGVASLVLANIVEGLEESMLSIGMSKSWVDYLVGPGRAGWRLLFLLGAAPALLTFLIRIFVPESERWLHASRDAPKPRVREIFAPALARKTILGTSLGAIALLGTWGSIQWAPAWANKLTEGLESHAGAAAWTQIASSMGAVVCTVLAALLADLLTRRAAYFLLVLGSIAGCAYLFWTPMEYGPRFLATVGVVGGLTASFYGWLPLYLPELFPTRLRATGQGFAFNSGRVLAAAGALLGGQLHKSVFAGDYQAMCRVISLVYLLGLVVIWFCPETKGRPLPE